MNCKERCWYHAWMRKSYSMLCSFRRGRAGCFGKLMLARCCLNWGNCIHKFVWINWCVYTIWRAPNFLWSVSLDKRRQTQVNHALLCKSCGDLTTWTTYFPSLRHYTFIHRLYVVLYTSTADCLYGIYGSCSRMQQRSDDDWFRILAGFASDRTQILNLQCVSDPT